MATVQPDDETGPFTWKRHGCVMTSTIGCCLTSGEDYGPLETEAYGASAAGKELELMKVTLPPLRSTQVQIEMSHCGLCHTELHMIDNDWGISDYPLVPGHEGLGKVVLVGKDVKTHKVGDTVGVGWIRDACKDCAACSHGRENLCKKGYQGTFLAAGAAGIWGNHASNEFGCFSKVMRIEADFAFKIPATLPPTIACPLMCAGGTVFEPIENYVKEGMTVGIAGIGGLGTLAVKLAKLYGAEVTAISRTATKKELALAAGADHFLALDDEAAMKAAGASFNFILDTSPAGGDPGVYQDLLEFDGKLVRVGIPPGKEAEFKYNWIMLIFTQRTIAGSIVTGSKYMYKLLALAERNLDFIMKNDPNWAAVERPFAEVNEAIAELKAGTNKGHRTVLTW